MHLNFPIIHTSFLSKYFSRSSLQKEEIKVLNLKQYDSTQNVVMMTIYRIPGTVGITGLQARFSTKLLMHNSFQVSLTINRSCGTVSY